MKRFLTGFFTALLLTAALCVSASASNFDAAAGDLAAIGIFRGDASGYALDRAPTRSEAAIMLVRLYGAEKEAAEQYAAGTISHPFTDVGETAAPYVAWLRSKGLANGISETAFGSSRPCTAQNYVVFLLRALGYQDGQDFQYADAASFAAAKGLLDTSLFSGKFLRDDLAALTYQALACDLKDGSTYLLASLVKSGAIDAAAAKPITDKIETYRALLAASAEMGNALDVNMTAKADVDVSVAGTVSGEAMNESMTLPMTFTGRIQMVLDEQPQMALTMKGEAMGEAMEMGMWMKDGWMYVQQAETSYKLNLGDQLDAIMGNYQQLLEAGSGQMSASMLPFIDTVTSRRSGSDTVYTLTLNGALAGMMDGIMKTVMDSALGTVSDMPQGLDFSMDLTSCSYTYTVGSNGKLKNVAANLKLDMGMDMEESAQNRISVKIGMAMDLAMAVNASGSAVQVTYPATLAQFPELIGGADGPTDITASVAA